MDESFVAKLLDVGTELDLPAGHVLVDEEAPFSGLVLVLRGLVAVETEAGEDERGPGQVVGRWERLDGSEPVRVLARTDVRVLLVDRAAYEAAVSG